MSSLLKFLFKKMQLVLSARLDDDEPDPVEDEVIEDENDDDVDESEEQEEEQEDEPAPKLSRSQAAIVKLRTEKREAEDKYQKARDELEQARRQPVQKVNSQEDDLRKQEEAILSNPEATDWQKYAVQSARDSRQATRNSNMALREAKDINDKAEFHSLATSQPKTFAAYKDRVETTLKEMRANGNDAPRKELFAYLVGQDMINGKLKTSTAKLSGSKTGSVKRGSTPGAKSDVSSSGSGKSSDAEKRAKRLENVRI